MPRLKVVLPLVGLRRDAYYPQMLDAFRPAMPHWGYDEPGPRAGELPRLEELINEVIADWMTRYVTHTLETAVDIAFDERPHVDPRVKVVGQRQDTEIRVRGRSFSRNVSEITELVREMFKVVSSSPDILHEAVRRLDAGEQPAAAAATDGVYDARKYGLEPLGEWDEE